MAKRLPYFLPDDEPDLLLRAAVAPRDRLLLLLGMYCGLRVSEMCRLRVEDVDFTRGVVTVRHGKGDKDRAIPLADKIVEPLRVWVEARRDGYLFPSARREGPLTTRAVQLLLKRLAQKAGLSGAKTGRRYTPHKLRHRFATGLLRSGADIVEVQELLGHANLATTAIYLHADPQRLRAAVNRL